MKYPEKLILVTNDDGIDAPGIQELISIAKNFGKVLVVAPDGGRSGMSHAVTMTVPLRVQELSNTEHLKIYSSNGTPVDCIKLAMHSLTTQQPDLILSGINHGANSSVNIFYSGTMAAAIEGCMLQIPSVGLSVCGEDLDVDFSEHKKDIQEIIMKVLGNGLPSRTCLNVNFPKNYLSSNGLKVCRQANAYWKEDFEIRFDTHNKPYYWLRGRFIPLEQSEDTDIYALEQGYASVVPVLVDITAHEVIDSLTEIFEYDTALVSKR
jgi:5'-nucleotidase